MAEHGVVGRYDYRLWIRSGSPSIEAIIMGYWTFTVALLVLLLLQYNETASDRAEPSMPAGEQPPGRTSDHAAFLRGRSDLIGGGNRC